MTIRCKMKNRFYFKLTLFVSALLLFALVSCQKQAPVDGKSHPPAQSDSYTLTGEKNFLSGYPAVNDDGSINVVVEIPAGTNAKWEVTKPDGLIKWEFVDGQPRVVQYLPYPGNYGMVPRTLLPKELGGDGDPLDVIVLGHSVSRGTVVRAKLVGVLKLLDRGEQDDKLLAVMQGSPLEEINNLVQLRQGFPGVLTIVETWFSNYKGPGKMETQGFADLDKAREILQAATRAYMH